MSLSPLAGGKCDGLSPPLPPSICRPYPRLILCLLLIFPWMPPTTTFWQGYLRVLIRQSKGGIDQGKCKFCHPNSWAPLISASGGVACPKTIKSLVEIKSGPSRQAGPSSPKVVRAHLACKTKQSREGEPVKSVGTLTNQTINMECKVRCFHFGPIYEGMGEWAV